MTNYLMAVGAATLAWFFGAAILFFNPIVDRIYRTEEDDPAGCVPCHRAPRPLA